MDINDKSTIEIIAYAAFQTHYNVTNTAKILPPYQAWEASLALRTLWVGIVKGVINNVVMAQMDGSIPLVIKTETPKPVDSPAAVARKLSEHIRDKQKAAQELAPGLAIGRCTEDADPPEGEHRVVLDALEGKSDDGDES